ncbi:MAG: hypothetical protein K6G03_03225 [Lachnospiraceae bacterium]|nr:hypothetical protein [Lachnospiraceae bacterium]
MEGKRLLDEDLENISGGLENIGKRHVLAYEVEMQCPNPKCHHIFKQKFYKDGSIEYPRCPKCKQEIGKG